MISNITESLSHCVSEITGHSVNKVHYNEQITREHMGVLYRISVICPHLDENPSGLLADRFPLGVNLIIFFGQFPDFKSLLPFNELILHFSEELRQISVIVVSSKHEWSQEYQYYTKETIAHMCPDLAAVAGKEFAFLTSHHGFLHQSHKSLLKEMIRNNDTKVSIEGMIFPRYKIS